MRVMRAIAVWTCFVVSSTAFGQAVPDGFYLLSDDSSAPSLPVRNGDSVQVGLAQEIGVERSYFYALDNANSQFHLTMWTSPDSPTIDSPFALVVSGRAYLSAGGTVHDTVDFGVFGTENAEQIARYLSTTIEYRRHPKHELLVEWIPTEEQFQIGEDVRAKLRITNVGTNTVSFLQGGQNRGSRDNQYVFSAWFRGRGVQDVGSNEHFGGLGVKRVLAPAEVFGGEVSLSMWFAFDQPGLYTIHGSYFLQFFDPDSENFGRTIWTDYVSADFTVRVSE
jgi:hypothetical protein